MKIWQMFHESWLFKPAVGAVAVFFLIIVVDLLGMPWYVKLGNERELPDVIEMSVAQATEALENKGFQVIVQDSMFDARFEPGTVIEQNPYAYALVKEGRRVYLTVSNGERPITMPNLFGKSPRDVELILKTNDLVLNARNYSFSDVYPEGVVIAQSYPQEQEVSRKRPIDITISLGKLEDTKVPELIGKSVTEAREKLRALNLLLGEISYEERNDILPETVLSQSVEAGSKPADGMEIDIVVSREKRPEQIR
jgi:beta-lactam-binding protein with PASTA domain